MKQKQSDFKCHHCGLCCSKIVLLTRSDIKRIEEAGYPDFLALDPGGNECTKRKNGYCIFMKMENGLSSCSIYDIRPEVCRRYPFFDGYTDECEPPHSNSFFRTSSV